VLPISHDEVVYGKPLRGFPKCRVDEWQKFANVSRGFWPICTAIRARKLLFMGTDIGDYQEWKP